MNSQFWLELLSLPMFCLTSICFGVYCLILLAKDTLCRLLLPKKLEGGEAWHTVVIGAGFSGLTMGARLKDMGVGFTIIEKAEDVGGTWWFNNYPGAACDVPSHLYSISFYPNPNWTQSFSK